MSEETSNLKPATSIPQVTTPMVCERTAKVGVYRLKSKRLPLFLEYRNYAVIQLLLPARTEQCVWAGISCSALTV